MADRYRYFFECESAKLTAEHEVWQPEWTVTVEPANPDLPTETIEVVQEYSFNQAFCAAARALRIYKERHGLPTGGEIWKP